MIDEDDETDDEMPDYEKKALVIQKRCAVTAFDLKVRVSKDGRDRGLWLGLFDTSDSRRDVTAGWAEDALAEWFARTKTPIDKGNQFGRLMAESHLRSAVGHLVKTRVEEMALLEWPQLVQVYKAIGEELKKRGLL